MNRASPSPSSFVLNGAGSTNAAGTPKRGPSARMPGVGTSEKIADDPGAAQPAGLLGEQDGLGVGAAAGAEEDDAHGRFSRRPPPPQLGDQLVVLNPGRNGMKRILAPAASSAARSPDRASPACSRPPCSRRRAAARRSPRSSRLPRKITTASTSAAAERVGAGRLALHRSAGPLSRRGRWRRSSARRTARLPQLARAPQVVRWPGCSRSKTPLVRTTFRPAARRRRRSAATAERAGLGLAGHGRGRPVP
jgi:hypothetical protein